MNPPTPSEPTHPRFYIPRPPRRRVSTADLKHGSRALILLHEGEGSTFCASLKPAS